MLDDDGKAKVCLFLAFFSENTDRCFSVVRFTAYCLNDCSKRKEMFLFSFMCISVTEKD